MAGNNDILKDIQNFVSDYKKVFHFKDGHLCTEPEDAQAVYEFVRVHWMLMSMSTGVRRHNFEKLVQVNVSSLSKTEIIAYIHAAHSVSFVSLTNIRDTYLTMLKGTTGLVDDIPELSFV